MKWGEFKKHVEQEMVRQGVDPKTIDNVELFDIDTSVDEVELVDVEVEFDNEKPVLTVR